MSLATLEESASDELLDAWIESIARAHGIGERVPLSTGLRFFP